MISAVKRRTIFDRVAMGFALFGISAPVFWLGLMALFIFWYKLDLTAGTGYVAFTDSPEEWASHLILPWIVLALLYAATYARMVRGSLLDTLGEDYIRTARAKGLSERRVIFGHGLRASLAPIVTMFGLDVALLVGGAVITESVFNLDGLGFMAIDSVFRGDLPATLGVVLVGTFAVVVDESPRRHRLRLPRPAGCATDERRASCSTCATSRSRFPTPDGVVNAVSGLSFTLSARRDARHRRRVRLGQERHQPRDPRPAQPQAREDHGRGAVPGTRSARRPRRRRSATSAARTSR